MGFKKEPGVCINYTCYEKTQINDVLCYQCLEKYWDEKKSAIILKYIFTLPLRVFVKLLGL